MRTSFKIACIKVYIGLVFVFCTLSAKAQLWFNINEDIPVIEANDTLDHAYAGGLNLPQFSAADLDNDGIEDLFIFDRKGSIIRTFLNGGSNGQIDYHHAPQFASNFPDINGWALLLDFNCDGTKDLFTSHTIGIRVYEGKYNAQDELTFDLFNAQLFYDTTEQIMVERMDVPGFADVNGDGDIDILTFETDDGSFMWYYENQSIELGYGCDSLIYTLASACWGEFYEKANSNGVVMNASCKRGKTNSGARHAGSTVLPLDIDGDSDMDVIIGDVSFNNLNMLTNGGTNLSAVINDQDSTFPSYDVGVDIFLFPGSYSLDLNNDDKLDLLVAPNKVGAINYNNIWYYNNTGSNNNMIFERQTEAFLVGEMIDVGEGPNPVFFDYNADGLMDIVVGNYGYYYDSLGIVGQLALFENIGSPTQPMFELIDRNYLDLATAQINALKPTFGDLDADGDEDMLLGVLSGRVIFFENTAGAGNPANFVLMDAFYQSIQTSTYNAPQLFDVNKDSLLDLLVGDFQGKLWYYENVGTDSVPLLVRRDSTFGNVNTSTLGLPFGNCVPYMTYLDSSGFLYLMAGAEDGNIILYGNIEANMGKSDSFDKFENRFSNIDHGRNASVHGADIDNDGKLELVVGNNLGGIAIYDGIDTNIVYIPSVPIQDNSVQLRAVPNPNNGQFWIKVDSENHQSVLQLQVYNSLGQLVYNDFPKGDSDTYAVDLKNYSGGIYFVMVQLVNGKEASITVFSSR